MLSLDIYFSSLSEKEQQKIRQQLKEPKYKAHPLISADIYAMHALQLVEEARKKNDLELLKAFHEKLNWHTDLEQILNHEYFALVLTDATLTIQWANKRFKDMTGYTTKFALGKTPRFLQGPNTTAQSRQRMRKQLATGLPFTETLVNYRKNKEEYFCKVSIFPLLNEQQQITHFLALEMETDQ